MYQVYESDNTYHQMPNWMPPSLHLILERCLTKIPSHIVRTPFGVLYHIVFGMICGYRMNQILRFLNIIVENEQSHTP